MSKKSIIALILTLTGIIINSAVVLGNLNIDSKNPEHIIMTIGMIIPGIFMGIIAGLIVGVIALLFLKNKSWSNFFVIFSIVFLIIILTIALGNFENKKNQEENLNINLQELSSPYISSDQEFQINFPSKPGIAQNNYSPYGIEGEATVYLSTKEFIDGKVIYYVIVNDMKALEFIDNNGRQNYYEQFPISGLADAGTKITKIFSKLDSVYKNYDGVEYKYKLETDGELLYKRGIDFIKNGKGYQISIIYQSSLDNQIEDIYTNYISSFSLLEN